MKKLWYDKRRHSEKPADKYDLDKEIQGRGQDT